jgi:hypothetical protein
MRGLTCGRALVVLVLRASPAPDPFSASPQDASPRPPHRSTCLGRFTSVSDFTINTVTAMGAGTLTLTAANGDQIFTTVTGEAVGGTPDRLQIDETLPSPAARVASLEPPGVSPAPASRTRPRSRAFRRLVRSRARSISTAEIVRRSTGSTGGAAAVAALVASGHQAHQCATCALCRSSPPTRTPGCAPTTRQSLHRRGSPCCRSRSVRHPGECHRPGPSLQGREAPGVQ